MFFIKQFVEQKSMTTQEAEAEEEIVFNPQSLQTLTFNFFEKVEPIESSDEDLDEGVD